jgi:hypothetical protein
MGQLLWFLVLIAIYESINRFASLGYDDHEELSANVKPYFLA